MISDTNDDLTVNFTGPGSADARGERAERLFAEHGCFLARGLLDDAVLNPGREFVRGLIALRLGACGQDAPPAHAPFDEGFQRLLEADEWNRVVLLGALLRSLPIQKIGLAPALVRLSKQIMQTSTVMGTSLGTIQVHLPGNTQNHLPWHQDYPFVRDSEDALIYWIPLRSLDSPTSGLRVALSSHRLGVLPMRGYGPRPPGGERALRIADPDVVNRFTQRTIAAEAGDVLVMSTLLLHASALNRSDRIRWTIQTRHGNFEHGPSLRRDWPACRPVTRFAGFEDTHPEYYAGTVLDGPRPEF